MPASPSRLSSSARPSSRRAVAAQQAGRARLSAGSQSPAPARARRAPPRGRGAPPFRGQPAAGTQHVRHARQPLATAGSRGRSANRVAHHRQAAANHLRIGQGRAQLAGQEAGLPAGSQSDPALPKARRHARCGGEHLEAAQGGRIDLHRSADRRTTRRQKRIRELPARCARIVEQERQRAQFGRREAAQDRASLGTMAWANKV